MIELMNEFEDDLKLHEAGRTRGVKPTRRNRARVWWVRRDVGVEESEEEEDFIVLQGAGLRLQFWSTPAECAGVEDPHLGKPTMCESPSRSGNRRGQVEACCKAAYHGCPPARRFDFR